MSADDGDIVDQIEQLTYEAKAAILEAIKRNAGSGNVISLERLAHSYALVVGAKPGVLPDGHVPPSS